MPIGNRSAPLCTAVVPRGMRRSCIVMAGYDRGGQSGEVTRSQRVRPMRRYGFRLRSRARERVFGPDVLGFDLAGGGPFVSALKEALDEQPDDCQRQPDEHKRQRATDNCWQTYVSPTSLFLHLARAACRAKKIVCGCSFSQRGNSTQLTGRSWCGSLRRPPVIA
jgi:hypothetical protein